MLANLARPKAILFDWDNTLVDTWPCITRATAMTLEAMGHAPWTPAEMRARIAGSLRDTFPKIYGARWEEARDTYYKAFEAVHLEMLRPLPGAPETIAALQNAGLYLGVVSNKTGRYLRAEANHLGWNSHFGGIVGAQDAARDKPEVDPVLKALEGSGIEPSPEVWFVGDAEIDIVCARNAGCTAIYIPPSDQAPVGEGPDATIMDLRALVAGAVSN